MFDFGGSTFPPTFENDATNNYSRLKYFNRTIIVFYYLLNQYQSNLFLCRQKYFVGNLRSFNN